jgi:hypothetical protein
VQPGEDAEHLPELIRTSLCIDAPEAYKGLGTNPVRDLSRCVCRRLWCRPRQVSRETPSVAQTSNEAVQPSGGGQGRPTGARWRSSQQRCYRIPEGGEVEDTHDGGMWMCPLTAPKEMLPDDAILEGNLLNVGAQPCMYACKLGRTRPCGRGSGGQGGGGGSGCSRTGSFGEEGALGSAEDKIAAPVAVPEAAKTDSLKQCGYIDWLGQSFAQATGKRSGGEQGDTSVEATVELVGQLEGSPPEITPIAEAGDTAAAAAAAPSST